jgi:hypothetical protein
MVQPEPALSCGQRAGAGGVIVGCIMEVAAWLLHHGSSCLKGQLHREHCSAPYWISDIWTPRQRCVAPAQSNQEPQQQVDQQEEPVCTYPA